MEKHVKLKKTDTIWLWRTTKGNLSHHPKWVDWPVGECLERGLFGTERGTLEVFADLTDATKARIEDDDTEVFEDRCIFKHGHPFAVVDR